MDDIKQKHHRLTHIIKSCAKTEFQLVQLKKSLDLQPLYDTRNKNPPIRPVKSISLLKSSRIHLSTFEKRHVKMNSFQAKGKYKGRNQIQGTQKEENVGDKKKKFRKIENIERKQIQESKTQQKQRKQNYLKAEDNKQKPAKSYLPQIESAYLQTFSPKNASLSQYSLAERQLEQSIYRKEHEYRCKKYNKENMMQQYENRRHENDQKLQVYRLGILKKISCDNVKKYLFSKMQTKQRNALFDREQRALCRSYMQRS